ncbi:MAG: N-acetyltransferase [Gammaproteobacteria bacterium]|nr:N-acetyltransferase [Gammaproteobacteria bacterium]
MDKPPGSDLVVQRVSGRKQLKEFIAFPQRIYSDDPNWVAPLWFEQLHRFSEKNPFFQHARWQAWTVRRGSEIVGRISAQIDDLYRDTQGEDVGFFGLIEAEDDPLIFELLFDTAENWLREQGIKQIRGPFNLSINEECGLLIDGYERPPFIMMGHARKYYADRIEAAGYTKAKDLLAYELDPDFDAPPVMRRLLQRFGKDISIRPLRRKQLKADLAILRDIFNDSWSRNWGFTPFTEAEFSDLGELLTMLVDDDFIQIAEIDGSPAAMIVVFPDINQAIKDMNGRLLPFGWLKLLWRLKIKYPDTARCMLMGVKKQYQQSRLGTTLAFLVIDTARRALVRRNINNVEMSWILEDNEGMKGILEVMGGDLYKRYRIYQKSL